ncbi:alkyl hydroperoxide reductase/ Thiol specific antioxidant/ Mal allergen [Chloroherpeton thalassium ATCC 35110]|uniref:Alkyl hydroperoxide reductase/ Thiol specific antioxidant/ Mal allergen n=1 Tax=Chloroherpeton thalassium (strain ATCC 35110 / GB-78) TaxID=517418 RepID=B3QS28_CHLT3|nr:TlpA disulfide reductase family protein [Chloroherpeton thalassium]ACF13973.1 alkyl hydroperoxide reductase/ Thiol specific antioxidant/ Mal allergen [Chloroherpeton thalassium ATCC 35110]
MAKNNALQKELKNWGIILAVFIFMFVTGLHRPVISALQQLILMTGLMKPDMNLVLEDQPDASYDLELTTLNGEKISLSEFEGKVVFMNLWATWCPPCVAEMPNIHSLYEKVHSDKIQFVMISLDDSPEKVEAFLERAGYKFPVFMLSGNRPQVYASKTIPTTFVISPNGKVATMRQGLASYDTDEFRAFLEKLSKL